MKRALIVLFALVLIAPAAFADITTTTSVSVAAAAMTADGTLTTYMKGTKLLTDASIAGQNTSQLLDSATKQQWSINHATKTIEPFNLAQAMGALPITFGDPKVSVKPGDETKQILGRTCQRYQVDISMSVTVGGESIALRMSGPAWVSKDGVGVAEYKAAQKAFADAGMATSPLGQGPQGKGMIAAINALAEAGMVLEQETKMTMEGTGPMAQAMGQAAGATITMKVTAISTDRIPDEKFALPEGYTKK